MKKILVKIRLWRYRRVFNEYMLIYAKNPDTFADPMDFADKAFVSLYGFSFEEYLSRNS